MKFLSELKNLDEAATGAPWFAEHVNDDGKIRIDDGRHDGLCSINAEHQEASLIVFLRNHASAIAGLVECSEEMLRHFTKTPSSLADTNMRVKLHAALSRLNEGAK